MLSGMSILNVITLHSYKEQERAPVAVALYFFFASATRNSATFGARFPIRNSATKRVVRKLRSCGVADLSCAMPTSA